MKSPNILAWSAAALSMALAFYTTYVSSGTRAAREQMTEIAGTIDAALTRADEAVVSAEAAAAAAAEAGATANEGLAALGGVRDEVAGFLAEAQAATGAAAEAAVTAGGAATAAADAQALAEAAAMAAGGATEGLDARVAALADIATRAEGADAAVAGRAAELDGALSERLTALQAAVEAVDAAAARAEAAAANAGEQAQAAQAAQIAAEAALTQLQGQSRPAPENAPETGTAADLAAALTVDGFNLDTALSLLAASPLDAAQQQELATALKAASERPALLPDVLTVVRTALGL